MPMLAQVRGFFLDLGHRAAVVAILLAAADLAAILYYHSQTAILSPSPAAHSLNPVKFLLAGTFGAEEVALIAAVVAWLFSAHLHQRTGEARGIALLSSCLALPTAAVILFPRLLGAV